jgi:hypothetical protein
MAQVVKHFELVGSKPGIQTSVPSKKRKKKIQLIAIIP